MRTAQQVTAATVQTGGFTEYTYVIPHAGAFSLELTNSTQPWGAVNFSVVSLEFVSTHHAVKLNETSAGVVSTSASLPPLFLTCTWPTGHRWPVISGTASREQLQVNVTVQY